MQCHRAKKRRRSHVPVSSHLWPNAHLKGLGGVNPNPASRSFTGPLTPRGKAPVRIQRFAKMTGSYLSRASQFDRMLEGAEDNPKRTVNLMLLSGINCNYSHRGSSRPMTRLFGPGHLLKPVGPGPGAAASLFLLAPIDKP